jgi:biopolymer transport protein TolQ
MGAGKLELLRMVFGAGLVVQLVLLTLVAFSIVSWAIILIKYRYLRRAFGESAQFIDYFWKSRDLTDAYARSKQLVGSPVARIFRVGYLELRKLGPLGPRGGEESEGGEPQSLATRTFGVTSLQRTMRRAISTEMTRMTQMVPFLATTGNTTPFIGLFGTVWGIMHSFHGIGQMGSASLAVVAPGISEALIATAAGLAAAIPAVIAFNFYTSKIRTLETELHSFAADFINIVERDILGAKGGGR